MKQFITVIILVLLLAPSAYSLTAAIGNARAVIQTEGSPENPTVLDRTLRVINKNDIDVLVHLSASQDLRPFINIIDNDFVLKPGEEKSAAFVLTIDRGGTIDGIINVLFSPADPEVEDNEVGLSSRLIIQSEGPILDEPEVEEETGTETETAPETEEETEENVPTQVEPETEEEQEEESDKKPVINNNNNGNSDDGASPLVGIGILVLVVIVGLGIFFGVMKILK